MNLRSTAIALTIIASMSLGACSTGKPPPTPMQENAIRKNRIEALKQKKIEAIKEKRAEERKDDLFTEDTAVVCCVDAGKDCAESTFKQCGGGFLFQSEENAQAKCTEACANGELAPANL